MNAPGIERTQRVTEWVTGGPYAVAVEVEALIPADDPSEPCLTPQTVRYLEELSDRAQSGDLPALLAAGKVYTRVNSSQAAR